MRKWSAVLMLAMLWILTPSTASAAAAPGLRTLMLFPAKMEYELVPGKSVSHTVQVVNRGDSILHVTGFVSDYTVGSSNTFHFLPPGDLSYSASKWITLGATDFVLKPQESRAVTITVSTPATVEPGGHYAAVLFQTTPNSRMRGVGIVARIGTLILCSPADGVGVIRNGEIVSFPTSNPWLLQDVTSRVVFRNSGNVHLTLQGEVVFHSLFGGEVGRVALPSITTLPRSDRDMDVAWKGPWFGILRAQAQVRYGKDLNTFDVKRDSPSVWLVIVPWPLILLLLAVTIIAVAKGRSKKRRAVREHAVEPLLPEATQRPARKGAAATAALPSGAHPTSSW